MAYGKSIELFLVNGTADSLTIAELSNWNGKAIKIPRIEVADCTRDDLKTPGIYFLFCKSEDEQDSVYIGEAENCYERLLQHLRDYQSDKEKYYWNTAVIFTGRDLTKAHIRYLENKCVEIARETGRYNVLTKNTYKNTVMKESQIAAMDEFVDNVQILINALGYKVLEPITHHRAADSGEEKYYISIASVAASGIETPEGFVVFKGATINEKTALKSLGAGMLKLRNELLQSDKVRDFVLKEDVLFSSSSAAADFLLGYSVSGPATWKDKNGKSLKEHNAM
ncbi:MAG: GIY-YIG nuclease family protein [Roseburia sp.]|nr:GIY-YIG nuclease family protein [Roseburia sp.]